MIKAIGNFKLDLKKPTKVAIISDTHGMLRQEVYDTLLECDKIIHAGDFDTEEMGELLDDIAPMYMVRGNNDWWIPYGQLQQLTFEIDGVKFFLIHNRMDIREVPEDTDVVVFGHTHQYYECKMGEQLWFNPGSCGRKRFGLPLTMAIMTIKDGKYKIKRIDLKE